MSTQPKTDHGTSQSRRRAKYLAAQDRKLLEKLVETRRTSGLSQEDVAELLGVSQQAVSKFEGMDSSPSLARVRHYAHAVGALVAHVVAEDSGQLEAHGDAWIQISFAKNGRHLSNSRTATTVSTDLKFTSSDTKISVSHTDQSHRHSTPLLGSVKNFFDISVAEGSKKTDFALGA